ncbi:cytochrome c oxidase subunit II [Intrasporangium calvum]|uniref:cytochrome-c oxidase n=1 Tax=Intrasporangium calvum TaxID=53358 RepID=A0ABT5GEY9_9MICO|nr:cytochrome c oxidase subunit II [Intrasporangium calvum]MDC5696708.1 cytochrome c oxidase subunit II [Intrasporangium calvum]
MHLVPEHEDTPVMTAAPHASARRRRGRRVAGLATVSALALAGCQGQVSNGFMPQAISDSGERVTDLWVGSWIAVLAVGVITWGLMLYAAVRFRRRKGDDTLPVQLRYNVPVELLYTIIPVFMVAVFFYYTARDEAALTDNSKTPDVTISVVGKQWSWDFNYVDSDVYETGVHTQLTGEEGTREQMPVLYLPVNQRVQFVLNSRDVIHSFWVPAFMTKLDMLPGKTNRLQIVPTQTGEFQGKCAELCGAYHAEMLFMVKVVTQEEYDQEMKRLAELGQTGQLPVDASREELVEGDAELIPEPARTGSN